jgi:hypothetical protein
MAGMAWPMSELEGYEFIGYARRVELLTAIQRQRAELDAREQVLLHAMHADPVPPASAAATHATARHRRRC